MSDKQLVGRLKKIREAIYIFRNHIIYDFFIRVGIYMLPICYIVTYCLNYEIFNCTY